MAILAVCTTCSIAVGFASLIFMCRQRPGSFVLVSTLVGLLYAHRLRGIKWLARLFICVFYSRRHTCRVACTRDVPIWQDTWNIRDRFLLPTIKTNDTNNAMTVKSMVLDVTTEFFTRSHDVLHLNGFFVSYYTLHEYCIKTQ